MFKNLTAKLADTGTPHKTAQYFDRFKIAAQLSAYANNATANVIQVGHASAYSAHARAANAQAKVGHEAEYVHHARMAAMHKVAHKGA